MVFVRVILVVCSYLVSINSASVKLQSTLLTLSGMSHLNFSPLWDFMIHTWQHLLLIWALAKIRNRSVNSLNIWFRCWRNCLFADDLLPPFLGNYLLLTALIMWFSMRHWGTVGSSAVSQHQGPWFNHELSLSALPQVRVLPKTCC